MLRGRRIIAAVLVLTLVLAAVPAGAMGRAAASPGTAGIVLPAGEELDEAALQEVTGKAGPLAGAAVVAVKAAAAWLGVRVAESAWNKVIEPALDKYVWSPIRGYLGL